MKIYIEDTDCYGLMYNGNYIRSYERALYRVAYEIKDFLNQKIYIGLLVQYSQKIPKQKIVNRIDVQHLTNNIPRK